MTRISRAEALTLGGILLLAVLARYTGLAQGFPRDFHWDERIYFHEALYGLANGLRRESTVSANLPYLLMPILLLQWLYGALTGALHSFADLTRAYIADPAPSLLLARAVWAASGVAGVAMAWRIGRRVSGPVVGLLAAFFLAGAFLHVEQSHFIKNDVPAALLLLCATDALFNIAERGARRDYFWAGFWIGLAAATKYYCAAVAPLILLAGWLHRRSARPAPGAAAPGPARLALSAAAGLLGVLLTTPVALIDPANLRDSLAWELGARFGSIPTGDLPQPLFYLTQHLGPGMGEPLLALGLAGGIVAGARLTPKSLLLVAVPVVFFIAINLRPNNFARYAVPAVPFLCVTAALALRTLVGAVLSPTLARLRGLALSHDAPALRALTSARVLRRLGPTLLALGAVAASAPSWLNVIRYDRFATAPDTRNAAQTWFEGAVPPGAAVLIEGGESFERTSNLGPQLWPTAAQLEARGPNEPRERFFWTQLLDVVRARPAYALQLVGAVERTSAEVNGQRVATAVRSMSEWGSPDYAVLINWRSDDLRPGSANPLWQSLNTEYRLVATFSCRPCFPEDYYAWRIDYPTLAQVPLLGGAPAGGPEVRVFQRLTTRFPARAPAAPP
jgi:hypothetical protein